MGQGYQVRCNGTTARYVCRYSCIERLIQGTRGYKHGTSSTSQLSGLFGARGGAVDLCKCVIAPLNFLTRIFAQTQQFAAPECSKQHIAAFKSITVVNEARGSGYEAINTQLGPKKATRIDPVHIALGVYLPVLEQRRTHKTVHYTSSLNSKALRGSMIIRQQALRAHLRAPHERRSLLAS